MTSARAVSLVAKREFVTKVRTRSFLIGTAVIIAVLAGYVVLQSFLFSDQQRSVVGLSGQATQLADPLREKARSFGIDVETRDVTSTGDAEQQVRDGKLDALVTGAPPSLKMIVKGSGNDVLTTALNDVTPNMPRFETVNVPPLSSGGVIEPSRTLCASARVCCAIAVTGCASASKIVGTTRVPSPATATPTLTRP